MKIAVIIIRSLLALLLLFASISYFFNLIPQPETHGAMKEFNEGLAASGYIMPVVKTLELLCGLCFISAFFVPLASVVLFPISVNILLVHSILAPEGLPAALFVILANLFLAFAYRDRYKNMLAPK